MGLEGDAKAPEVVLEGGKKAPELGFEGSEGAPGLELKGDVGAAPRHSDWGERIVRRGVTRGR
jgi:hypothetical protein